MEETISFGSDPIKLYGLLDWVDDNRAVVITHPHPLYGGNMHNPVVESMTAVYHDMGYSTLRFDFRGVGQSGGVHDNGLGEQDDVLSAVSYLAERGVSCVNLAGYSFGAWVNGSLDLDDTAAVNGKMVMVSPPVGFLDFNSIISIPTLRLIVSGSRDEIAPPESIATRIQGWNSDARLEVIPDADHFYSGHRDKLILMLQIYISEFRKSALWP